MKNRSILVLSLFLAVFGSSAARAGEDGFSLYKQGKYAESAKAFAKADMDRPDEIRFRYNRGVAALKAKDAEAGEAALESAYTRAKDPEVRYRSAYNLGNASFEKKDYRKAADYYKKALKEKPGDSDARSNFQLALWNAAKAEKEKSGKKPENGKDQKDSQKGQDGKKDGDKKDSWKDENKGQGKDGKQEGQKEGQKDSQQDGNQGDPKSGQKQGQNDAGQGQQVKNPPPSNPDDLKGALTAQGQQAKSGQGAQGNPGQKAQSMEYLRAKALVENVAEDPSLLFRSLNGKRGKIGSGKNW